MSSSDRYWGGRVPFPGFSKYDLSQLEAWPPARREILNYNLLHVFVQRVRTLCIALLLAGLVVAIRYGNLQVNGRPLTVVDYTLVPPMVTIAAFIMGTVLNNIISDYKVRLCCKHAACGCCQ